jgi:uncharacterized protein (TIGR03435 family)
LLFGRRYPQSLFSASLLRNNNPQITPRIQFAGYSFPSRPEKMNMRSPKPATVLCLFLFASCACAQSVKDPSPSYEVASIKIDHGDPNRPITWDETPDGLTVTNVTLELLIRQADGIQSYQIESAPEWVNEEEYDISARIDDAETRHLQTLTKRQAQAERRLMLQALLAERFQLAAHHETKEGSVYALVVAKNGPKFREAAPPAPPQMPISMGEGLLTFKGAPVSTLARLISQVINRPVLDHTGLTGKYAFTLKWTPDEFDLPATAQQSDEAASEPAGTSIFTVIQDQLGLKLESTKSPVDSLVIDHVSRPSPN